MITIVIGILIGLGFSWMTMMSPKGLGVKFEKHFSLLPPIFGGIVGFFVALGLSGSSSLPITWVEEEEIELAAIQQKDGLQGSFFLASGNFEEKPYYFYYIRYPDGSFVPQRLPADGWTRTYQEKRVRAVIKIYGARLTDPVWKYFVIFVHNLKIYEFRVPEGSIKQTFSMN